MFSSSGRLMLPLDAYLVAVQCDPECRGNEQEREQSAQHGPRQGHGWPARRPNG
jgi:hypothetical protein